MTRGSRAHRIRLAAVGAWGGAALLVATASPAAPISRVTLQLRQVSVHQTASQLAAALGAPVRLEGQRKAPVTVDVTDVSGREALDTVAAAVEGRWQRVYIVSGRGKGGGAGRLPSGRLVTLNIDDTSVAAAAAMVARAAGARLELEEVPDEKVSVAADSEPVEAVFDRIAKAAGLQWRAEYILTVAEPAGKQPARPGVGGAAPSGRRASGGVAGGSRVQRRLPAGAGLPARPGGHRAGVFASRPILTPAPPADQALCQVSFYRYIFSLPRSKREPFVQSLAAELKAGAVDLPTNPSLRGQLLFERRQRRATIVAILRTLPEAQRRELKPISDVVLQGMPMGTESGEAGVGQRP